MLLVINFSMDFLALYITSRILHIKTSPKRLTLSALLGALYSLIILLRELSGIIGFAVSVAFSLLLCLVAFGKSPPKAFIKTAVVFYTVNFALGGGITAICNLLNLWKNSRNLEVNGTFDILYGDVPFGYLAILGIVCGVFSLISGKFIKNKKTRKTCHITLKENGQCVVFEGLLDSGNLLKEPISGRPVIITGYRTVRPVLPPELLNAFKEQDTTGLKTDIQTKLRLIPVSSVGGSKLLFGFIPQSITLDGRKLDCCIAVENETKKYGECDALVPAVLVE